MGHFDLVFKKEEGHPKAITRWKGRGGMEEEGATMHCKKPKAHATIAQ
jgi:hypothetical protein